MLNIALPILSGSTWFSTLDLNSKYWQVETDTPKKKMTGCRLCQFNVMPLSLCKPPAIFERHKELVLRGLT